MKIKRIKKKKLFPMICIFILILNMLPSFTLAKEGFNNTSEPNETSIDKMRGNLLLNPGFEDGLTEWTFVNSYNDYKSGSGIQTNNPYTGSKGFFLDGNSKYAIKQAVTVPFSGLYNTSAFISTGGSGSKLGVRYVDGDIIEEITIPNNSTYVQHKLPPIELKQGDQVEVYSLGGQAWVNGDDFEFVYDFSQVSYNLIKNYELIGNSPFIVRVPRDGDYLFSAKITSIDNVTVNFDGQKDEIPAGKSEEVYLVTTDKSLGDELNLVIQGNYEIEDAKVIFDVTNIPNEKPVAKDVSIQGNPHSGATLSGLYTFFDQDEGQTEGSTKFNWLSSDSPDGEYEYIKNSISDSLSLSDELENKFIKFEVTPVDSLGLEGDIVTSEPFGPIKINWVRNPGLEHEDRFSSVGWETKNGGLTPNDSNKARTGFRFAEIPANAPTAEVSYKIPIERTAYYSAGAWVKTNTDGGELGIRIVDSETPLKSVSIPSSDSFEFVSIDDFAIEKNSEIEIYIKGTKNNSVIIADDFQVLIESTENLPKFANLFTFEVEGQVRETKIDNEQNTIEFFMPYGTDVTSLGFSAEISDGAVIEPKSGSKIDFSNPVTIIVKNGTVSKKWTVTASVLEKNITLKSDNKLLEESFNWAVRKTNQFVMTGKSGYINKDENRPFGTGVADYMPSYWAGYYDRTAFYSRDFVHQAIGAQIVGLEDENYSMFSTFAENATEARKWYTLWAINFDGSPHTIDYKDDSNFVREVPAQFELVEKAYKQYLWTGDERYIKDPSMWNFYTKVMTDFITLHDTNDNGVAEGTGKGIFDGAASYNERSDEPIIEAGDSIGSQYQATLAYAGMLKARGEEEDSVEWFKKAAELKRYFNEEWSVYNGDSDGIYARAVTADGTQYNDFGKENSWFMPMKLITEPGERNEAYLDFISEKLADGIGTGPDAPNNIEAYTYIPDTFFPYNHNEEAWKWMKYIMERKDLPHERPSQGTNGDYPEISFTFVSQTIEGLMGVEANAPDHMVATAARLPAEIEWVEADHIVMGDHTLNISHDGLNKTTLKNDSTEDLTWEARFYEAYDTILIDGVASKAQKKEINGETVSYILIPVDAGETVVAEVNESEAADYTAVEDAIADIPADLSIYTADSVKKLESALAAVEKDLTANEQDRVDAMAQAITDAIEGLELIELEKAADYTAVEDAIASIPTDLSIYTADSVKKLESALAAVEKDLTANEQDRVDAMAQAITDAIGDLKLIESEKEPEISGDHEDSKDREDEIKRTDLEKSIKDAEKKNKADYTSESWSKFEEALFEAKTALKNKSASQVEIDTAINNLKQAIADLKVIPSEGLELPKTASDMFNLLVIGFLLFLVGGTLLYIRKTFSGIKS